MKDEQEIEKMLRGMKPRVSPQVEDRALDRVGDGEKLNTAKVKLRLFAVGLAVVGVCLLLLVIQGIVRPGVTAEIDSTLPVELFEHGSTGRHVLGDDGNLYFLYQPEGEDVPEEGQLLSTISF